MIELEAGFTIKQASEQTGITGDTLRYYEKIGLIPRAQRKENRHRIYKPSDINTIKLITCLKKTGMSLEEIKPFLNYNAAEVPSKFPELTGLLQDHKKKVLDQIASLQQVVDFIDSKLAHGASFEPPAEANECQNRQNKRRINNFTILGD